MLNIQHFTKTYGEKRAVDDLSLHIAPGEIYGFIGHNGAGKTTTLKAAVGILQFDAGEITIGGHSIQTEPLACKQLLAYIPDNPDLYDFMSGIQYLNFIADVFGIPAAERWARIEPYADAFELTGDLGQPISAYSHGMKQKLAIIAAWIHDPKLIIMDEPFVGLDPKAAHLLKGMMRELCDVGGAIIRRRHHAQHSAFYQDLRREKGRRQSRGRVPGAGGCIMLKTLLKKQMAEIFRNYFYDPKKNKMRSRGATIAYIVLYALLMVGLLGGIFALMAVGLCGPLVEGGMDWLYYLLVGLIAVFLGTFGSVFSTYSSLYLSKDNDLLLSLPIPVRCVMASRLLGVYLLGLMYAAVVIVPGVIVYWLTAPVTAGTIVGGVLMVLIVSVIVMVLSCLLGWVVARISLKLKNKSFITVLLSLLFLAAYYFVYYKAQALITLLVENAAVYGMKIRGSAYLLYLFGSVGAGDWLAMGIVTVTQAALLALTLWGIARSFLKIATATGSVKKVRFEHRAVRAQSVQRALFGKELRRFTASPNYMLNCGLGILMLPVAGIVLLIKGGALGRMLADVFSGNVGVVPVLMCAAVCLLASMNDMAAPAVSLEGRNLWLVQSLPVVPWQALRAKLDVQLVLTGVPVLFCALCMVIVLPGSALEKALLVIVALLYTLLSALAALALGLKMPNLTWTNETTPIKQSGCVMLSLFANWFYALALGGLYFLCGNALSAAVYLAIFAVVTAAGSALLLHWVKQRGARIFAAL